MSENDAQKWYYDTKTGQVSQGKDGAWENRMGPYDSREEAEAAIATAQQRTKEAEEYDAEENDD